MADCAQCAGCGHATTRCSSGLAACTGLLPSGHERSALAAWLPQRGFQRRARAFQTPPSHTSVCPSQVLIMAGTNDLKRRTAPEITSSLEQLHATCHAAGTRTLALGIPHSKASTVGSRGRSERRREVNACACVR
jgi:hypothetical protein